MSQKKIFQSIEIALQQTPREQWSASAKVSRSLLDCARLRGIVRNHMLKRGVSIELLDDVTSEIAVVMQMKMLEKLEKVEDVYFVAYRVSQLVVSNYGKKSINTSYSEEVSLSTLLDDDDNESDALERLNSDSAVESQQDANEKRIDLDNAKRRFTAKMNAVGWPSDIKRERTRLGRPLKQNPILPGAAAA